MDHLATVAADNAAPETEPCDAAGTDTAGSAAGADSARTVDSVHTLPVRTGTDHPSTEDSSSAAVPTVAAVVVEAGRNPVACTAREWRCLVPAEEAVVLLLLLYRYRYRRCGGIRRRA